MPKFIVGARLHDYGKGSPDELFGRVAADGFAAVQLAYKKCVPSVRSYADVTDALVAETVAAEKAHTIQVAVLGTYVELAINDESRLKNAADFKSQLAVCKALGAGCIGTETTSMEAACRYDPRGSAGAALPQSGGHSARRRGTGRDRRRRACDLPQHELRRRDAAYFGHDAQPEPEGHL